MASVIRIEDIPEGVEEGEIRAYLDSAGANQCILLPAAGRPVEVTYGDRRRNALAADRLRRITLRGQTLSIKLVSSTLMPPEAIVAPSERRPDQRQATASSTVVAAPPPPIETETRLDGFHNPYTFVPTPPRSWAKGTFAGDASPAQLGLRHDRLDAKKWTGTIPIRIIAKTPVLLLKSKPSSINKETDHETYDIESRPEGSGLRGVLRSAYETVTNSRYGGFAGHEGRIGYRMMTDEARGLVPVLVERGTSQNLVAHLLPGIQQNVQCADGREGAPLPGASLPFWGPAPVALPAPPGGKTTRPTHGQEVAARIRLLQHVGRNAYLYWKVLDIWPTMADAVAAYPGLRGASGRIAIGTERLVAGRVAITNKNMGNKHDERLFYWEGSLPVPVPLDPEVVKRWKERIEDYRSAHRDREIFGRGRNPWDPILPGFGQRQGKPAWSPHQYIGRRPVKGPAPTDPLHAATGDWAELKPGDLAWARVDAARTTVIDLFPVIISRELNPVSPQALLDESLWPSHSEDELSPADRLFGWVARRETGGEAACKGRLRVVPASALSEKEIEKTPGSGNGLPLPILAAPKATQGRFYVARDKDGSPLEDGAPRPHYDKFDERSLRGRKHYPHHPLTAPEGGTPDGNGYWDPRAAASTANSGGMAREYVRAGGVADDQNRSVTGWIKPGSVIRARLEVENLMPEEVGALVWLLSLPAGHYLRLGFGKPLGFGSVRLEIDAEGGDDAEIPLAIGERWTAKDGYYSSVLGGRPSSKLRDLRELVVEYQKAMCPGLADEAVPKAFESLSFIKAFLAVCRGKDGAPTHYPRMGAGPDLEGENFRWFAANERGRKRALPAATDGTPLPRQG